MDVKEYQREYYFKNKEKKREYDKQYRLKTKERRQLQQKNYLEANKESIIEYKKKWYQENKPNILLKIKNRKKSDPLFRVTCGIRSLINKAINRKSFTKNSKTQEILGCTFEEFKQYLESKFEPWMNWDNYGLYNGELNYGWDIDHIKPVITATNIKELYELNHYLNLQPLCSYYNRHIKKDKVVV
jgi:hypothetical protein